MLLALAAMAMSLQVSEITTGPNDPIVAPPESLSYGGFYKKCAYFRGIPIIASEEVDDRAFRVLIHTLTCELANVPMSTTDWLLKQHSHYSIIGKDQGQTDLPEYANLRNDPKTDWNRRARGLGGRITSAAEENILELPQDRYKGESIYIHEFGHTLADHAFKYADPVFQPSLDAAYAHAMTTGLWAHTYSATNYHEYWAEGVQMYFDCARSASPPNGVHNEICNRVGLEKYDPQLYAVVDKAFGHNPWRYEGSYCTTNKVVKIVK